MPLGGTTKDEKESPFEASKGDSVLAEDASGMSLWERAGQVAIDTRPSACGACPP
jgi:hypothetical protein